MVFGVRFPFGAGFAKGRNTAKMISVFQSPAVLALSSSLSHRYDHSRPTIFLTKTEYVQTLFLL